MSECLQVFNPDYVDAQLETAMIEFLNHHTIFVSEGILKIPEILLIHLEITNSNQEPESNAIIPSLACKLDLTNIGLGLSGCVH